MGEAEREGGLAAWGRQVHNASGLTALLHSFSSKFTFSKPLISTGENGSAEKWEKNARLGHDKWRTLLITACPRRHKHTFESSDVATDFIIIRPVTNGPAWPPCAELERYAVVFRRAHRWSILIKGGWGRMVLIQASLAVICLTSSWTEWGGLGLSAGHYNGAELGQESCLEL